MELVAVGERVLARSISAASWPGSILDEERRRVDPHSGGTPVEPEPRTSSCSAQTSLCVQLRRRLVGREQVEVPLARHTVVAGAVHAEPPKIERQPFGGSAPSSPLPGRNQKRARSAEPGGDASAAWNHGCWSETWFGTMSTIVRIPSARASASSCSACSSVPSAGSIDR